MSGIALVLVLASAFLHATWNYLTKKSEEKVVFIWLFLLASGLFYLPFFLYFFSRTAITSLGWLCITATILLHAFYFWFLSRAYEKGELSLVYPLARGMGPFFVPFLAVGFIGESLSFQGISGIALIILGIYTLHLTSFTRRDFFQPILALRGHSSRWALSTGGTIALYSLVDKIGVSQVNPLVYVYLMFVGAWFLLSPYVLTRRGLLLQEWRKNRNAILIVGFLSLFTYFLVLFAMQVSKISYIAALRESSIVFSTHRYILAR